MGSASARVVRRWRSGSVRNAYSSGVLNHSRWASASIGSSPVHAIGNLWTVYTDLQYRWVDYVAKGIQAGQVPIDVDRNYGFFNPKAGVTYRMNPNQQLYFSVARAHKEPNRTDFENGNPLLATMEINGKRDAIWDGEGFGDSIAFGCHVFYLRNVVGKSLPAVPSLLAIQTCAHEDYHR